MTSSKEASWTSKFRDLAYNTVFHVGDTALQFTADLIHGPDNYWSGRYHKRQINKSERAEQKRATKQKATPRPLSIEERKVFSSLLTRQNGETIIEHWKRRKRLLAHPNKHELVRAINVVSNQAENTQKPQDKAKLEAQFRKLSQAHQSSAKKQGQKNG